MVSIPDQCPRSTSQIDVQLCVNRQRGPAQYSGGYPIDFISHTLDGLLSAATTPHTALSWVGSWLEAVPNASIRNQQHPQAWRYSITSSAHASALLSTYSRVAGARHRTEYRVYISQRTKQHSGPLLNSLSTRGPSSSARTRWLHALHAICNLDSILRRHDQTAFSTASDAERSQRSALTRSLATLCPPTTKQPPLFRQLPSAQSQSSSVALGSTG